MFRDYLNRDLLRLVAPLAVAQIVSWGSMIYSFPLFLEPMEGELGWSRTELTGAYSLSLLVAGLCAFPVGWWIDRHGGHWPMTLGSILAALLLFAGWHWAAVRREPRYDPEFVAFVRKKQRARMSVRQLGEYLSAEHRAAAQVQDRIGRGQAQAVEALEQRHRESGCGERAPPAAERPGPRPG